MADETMEEKQAAKVFEVALAARNFEIELLWRRSQFFWGFLIAAFAGFGVAVSGERHVLAALIGCFGFYSAVCWSWVNRGSKFWSDVWEKRTEEAEQAVLGKPLFDSEYPDLGWSGFRPGHRWLGPHRYSVTSIAIGVSDFTASVWIGATVYELLVLIDEGSARDLSLALSFAAWTCIALIATYAGSRRTQVYRRRKP